MYVPWLSLEKQLIKEPWWSIPARFSRSPSLHAQYAPGPWLKLFTLPRMRLLYCLENTSSSSHVLCSSAPSTDNPVSFKRPSLSILTAPRPLSIPHTVSKCLFHAHWTWKPPRCQVPAVTKHAGLPCLPLSYFHLGSSPAAHDDSDQRCGNEDFEGDSWHSVCISYDSLVLWLLLTQCLAHLPSAEVQCAGLKFCLYSHLQIKDIVFTPESRRALGALGWKPCTKTQHSHH